MERNVKLVTDDVRACKWTFRFESVVGLEALEELTTDADKAYGLDQIMAHYSGKVWQFSSGDLAGVRLWRITVDSVTGKRSG